MNKKLLVYSVDALFHEDLQYLAKKPNFSKLFFNCAEVERICTVYPSLTYPAHTSIITGCWPQKHGIIDNDQWRTDEAEGDHWFREASLIQCQDIFSIAKKAGLSTSAVFWPVTGNHPNIDYLINEIFPNRNLGKSGILKAFADAGSDARMIEIITSNFERYPVHNRREIGVHRTNTYDDFLIGCACDIIRKYAPDLMFVHNSYIDTARHQYGVFNENIDHGLDLVDETIGELVAALRECGIEKETNFVLVSDHGQLNFARRIRLNTKLVRDGYITKQDDGAITDWKIFVKSTGMSAFVYLKDADDKELYDEAYQYLKKLGADGVWGFEKVYTRDQVQRVYSLYGEFSFMLETDGYTAFADSWQEPITNPIDLTDYRLGMATHGYEPSKGPQPVFLGSGPAFIPGSKLKSADIVDEATTFAKILGLDYKDSDGRCLDELLRLDGFHD